MENKQEVKPKGLKEILNEDSALQEKMTLEQFNSHIKTGIDNSNIEEAYKSYCKRKYREIKK